MSATADAAEPRFFPELPKLDRVLRALDDIGAFNPHDGAGYELRKLRWYRDALFLNFAPFSVGDRVVLHTTFQIPADSGWRGREEMMTEGATAVVRAVDWRPRKDAEPGDGYFAIAVLFDHEWSVSKIGGEWRVFERPDDERHLFWFGRPEGHWRRVDR